MLQSFLLSGLNRKYEETVDTSPVQVKVPSALAVIGVPIPELEVGTVQPPAKEVPTSQTASIALWKSFASTKVHSETVVCPV
ncbi:hypothetical protein AGMMS49991_05280 [Spirochaetia bacterium]|nr:hypothetical protein AGMMS49991_05280 [Spirochaetia bacterium]